MVYLMFLRIISKSKLKSCINKHFFLSSAITTSILLPPNAISQPLTKPKFSELNIYSSKSFVTKAVEKTGSSVVTIDTQRYIKKKIPKKFSTITRPIF